MLSSNSLNIFQIAVELPGDGYYDQSNELVLPSTKRKTKIKTEKMTTTRILSKKHRKRLEKIIEKKKKKENVSCYHTNFQSSFVSSTFLLASFSHALSTSSIVSLI